MFVLYSVPPKTLNKEELNGCVGFIYSGLEDRNADIRKASNEAIYPFLLHLGYDAMSRHASKVKVNNHYCLSKNHFPNSRSLNNMVSKSLIPQPSSKNTVMGALEKAKALLPVKAAPPPASKGLKAPGRPASASSGVSRGPAGVRKTAPRAHSATKTVSSHVNHWVIDKIIFFYIFLEFD